MGSLDGRVALVTGAGRGIGREEALFFAAEGAEVVVNDPGASPDGSSGDASVAAVVVDEIHARGGTAVASTDSVSDWQGARRIVDTPWKRSATCTSWSTTPPSAVRERW